MKVVLLLVLAALCACTCASPASPQLSVWPQANKGRVTGGSNAVANQFPYQVSLQWGLLGIYQHICGGSIISSTYVLSAGHCITEVPNLGSKRITAGILNINDAGVTIDVAEELVHPNYQGGVNPNDLSLLRLASALSFSQSIQPIGLPTPNSEPEGTAVLSGWGLTASGSSPNILQYVDIPILTYQECDSALADLLGDSEPLDATSNVCTGPLYDGISACSGDSGGPLAQQDSNEIIGIVSWGISPCGYEGAPSVYTKVSSFVDFIQANVADLPKQ